MEDISPDGRTHMIEITSIRDEDLLLRSAAGDEASFVALYRRRHAGVFRFALHMSGNAAAAEEIAQEVFLTVIREGGRFDPSRGSAQAYLYGIARNHLLRLLERDRHYTSLEEEPEGASFPGEADPLRDLTRSQAVEAVRQAVLSLPANYREALVLCDLEELDYAQAAEALGVPVGTIRSRLNRGRTLLVEKLKSGWGGASGKRPLTKRIFA